MTPHSVIINVQRTAVRREKLAWTRPPDKQEVRKKGSYGFCSEIIFEYYKIL